MQILFIANRVPYPPYRGDKLKIYNLARRLAPNNTLHLLTIAETKADLQHINELKNIFTSIQVVYLSKWQSRLNVILGLFGKTPLQVAYFKSRKFEKCIQATNFNQYQAVHIQHLRMSQYVNKIVPKNAVLDLPDAFSLYWFRRWEITKNPFFKIFNKLEAKRLQAYENKILPQFNLNLACNQEDVAYLKTNTKANVQILHNGVDTQTWFPSVQNMQTHNRILFSGNMSYAPNIDAVLNFVQNIFPIILKDCPKAIFIIAGMNPVKAVLNLATTNIIVTGFVKNLNAEYQNANVIVSPLRFGAGTQNKVLEAMACAKPVVCSHIGFKGLNVEQGQGIWSYSDDSQFANKVVELLKNTDLANKTGQIGMQTIVNQFSWDIITQQLQTYFNKIKT